MATMMDITIEYWGQLRLAVGVRTEVIRIERGRHVKDLLGALSIRHGEAFGRLVFGSGSTVHSSTFIAIDDRGVRPGDVNPLEDGNLLTIATPMGGG